MSLPVLAIVAGFKRYLPLIKYGSIAIGIFFVLYLAWDYSKVKQLQQFLSLENQNLAAQMKSYQQQLDKQTQLIINIRDSNSKIELNFIKTKQEIEKLQKLSAQQIVTNKPEVEKTVNKVFKVNQNIISCSSGDLSKCIKQ